MGSSSPMSIVILCLSIALVILTAVVILLFRRLQNSQLEGMEDRFRGMAASALESNAKQFLEMAKSSLEKENQSSSNELEKRKVAIESLVRPLNEALAKYQSQLQSTEKDQQLIFGKLEQELKQVSLSHQTLSRETSALKDALKKPHVRGRWGEVQLKNCVELAGMSEFADVNFQDVTDTEDGRYIPDMTVRMPGGRLVVVDCKTPLEAFVQSLEALDEKERNAENIRHGKHVKEHVRKLSSKSYSDKVSHAADFTVMFLPNESFLYAALEVEPDLMEYAIERKVLIATPPTLIGLLKVIRYGWNEERLAENAEKISEAGKELHKRVCDFMDAYEAIGKSLSKARDEYDKGLSRLNSRVLVQAQRLEKLGAKSKKSLPELSGEKLPELQ